MTAQVATGVDDRSRLDCRRLWEATLTIDQTDPFFFDHPLDHVPAMLLLEGVLRTAERAAAESAQSIPDGHLARLRLEFTRFCELTSPPVVRIWPDAEVPGRWLVEFRQDGAVIGSGDLGWRPATATPTGRLRRPAPPPEPVAAHLVHRERPENVLVGGFRQVNADAFQVDVLPPPPGHYFRRRSGHFRPMGELVEGARQFGTLLGHAARDVKVGMRFIVRSLEVELNRPVSRAEPVTIVSRALPERRRSGTGRMTFAIRAGGATIGTATALGSAVSTAVYARMRTRTGGR